MSLSVLVVLAARQVPSSGAWQAALEEHRVPIQLAQPLDFNKTFGFVAVMVAGHDSGFYFKKQIYSDLTQYYPALSNVRIDSPVAVSLQFGNPPRECAAAVYFAALLVARFNAVAFDPQAHAFRSEQQLLEAAQQCESLGEGR